MEKLKSSYAYMFMLHPVHSHIGSIKLKKNTNNSKTIFTYHQIDMHYIQKNKAIFILIIEKYL